MNIPNLLTTFRLSLTPVYMCLFFFCRPLYVPLAVGILLVAGLTDIADGYWARRTKQVTELGKVLDPLADKLLALVVFFCLFWDQKLSGFETATVVARDVALILCWALIRWRGMRTVAANWLGKASTILLYPALLGLLLEWSWARPLLWIVIAISYGAAWWYLWKVWFINTVQRSAE